MSISVYDGIKIFAKKFGKFAAIGRWQWTQCAIGIELIPWGIIVFLGPVSIGIAHIKRNLEAEKGKF